MLTAFFSTAVANVNGQPANDQFAQRTLLESNVASSLSGATSESGEPLLPGISSGQTAWWTWGAPSNGIVKLSISASNFSPLVTVFTGNTMAELSLVASNDYLACYSDGICGCHWRMRSEISFHVAQHQFYQIAVDSAIITDASINPFPSPPPPNLQQGLVGINEQAISPPPSGFTTNVLPGDVFAMHLDFTPAPVNDDFANRIRIAGSGTRVRTSNAGATKEPGEPEPLGNAGGSSVWYSWKAPASGRVSLSQNLIPPYLPPSSSSDPIGVISTTIGPPSCGDLVDQNPPPRFFPLFTAFSGGAVDALTPANCLPMNLEAYPNAVEFDAVRGQTYEIAFDGNMGTTGDVTMFLALTQPASNDRFSRRIAVRGINIAARGYNAGVLHQTGEPVLQRSSGKNVWWSWKAPTSGTVRINLLHSDYAFPVGVFTGAKVEDLQAIAEGIGSVSFEATQGEIYQIAVGDAMGLTGGIKFTLEAPVVVLPMTSERGVGSSTVISFAASPGQGVLLQQSLDGTTWRNVRVLFARSYEATFFVWASGSLTESYRAIVVE